MNVRADDPRHRNDLMDGSTVDSYKCEYANRLKDALDSVSSTEIQKLCESVMACARNKNKIFVVGNGGSAAIADHLCCDWTKGTNVNDYPVIWSSSLTSNLPLYSAIANDFGFERVFDTQIGFFGRQGDVLIAISSSGNSRNILNAVTRAREVGMFVAAFTGFDGGSLSTLGDVSIHVPVNNYGIVEDTHQAVMHVIAQYIACRRDRGEPE